MHFRPFSSFQTHDHVSNVGVLSENSYSLEKMDQELEPVKITVLEKGWVRIDEWGKSYNDTVEEKWRRRIDQVQGFPCLFVPTYIDINNDTGKINCDWIIDRRMNIIYG